MRVRKLNEDLALFTNISEKTISKVLSKSIYSIGDAFEQCLKEGDDTLEMVTDIGSIFIQFKEGNLRYKFSPNAKLREELLKVSRGEESSLCDALESSVITKFEDLYKELC